MDTDAKKRELLLFGREYFHIDYEAVVELLTPQHIV